MRDLHAEALKARAILSLSYGADVESIKRARFDAIARAQKYHLQWIGTADAVAAEIQGIEDAYQLLIGEHQTKCIHEYEGMIGVDRFETKCDLDDENTLNIGEALGTIGCRLTDAELGQAYFARLQAFRECLQSATSADVDAAIIWLNQARCAYEILLPLHPDERSERDARNTETRCLKQKELELQQKRPIEVDLRRFSANGTVLSERSRYLQQLGFEKLSLDLPEQKSLLRLLVLHSAVELDEAKLVQRAFQSLPHDKRSWLITGLTSGDAQMSEELMSDSLLDQLSRGLQRQPDARSHGIWNLWVEALAAPLRVLAETFRASLQTQIQLEEDRLKNAAVSLSRQSSEEGLYGTFMSLRVRRPLSIGSRGSSANRSLRDGGTHEFEQEYQYQEFSRPRKGSGASSYAIERGSPGLPPLPNADNYMFLRLSEDNNADEISQVPELKLKRRSFKPGDTASDANSQHGTPTPVANEHETSSQSLRQSKDNQRECYMCEQRIAISRKRDWQLHVLDDLEPYQCMEVHCPSPNASYARRSGLRDHYTKIHPSSAITSTSPYKCPFCEDVVNGKLSAKLRHVGRHMEELTYSIVPRQYEQWDFYTDAGTLSAMSLGATKRVGQESRTAAPLQLFRQVWSCKSLESYKAAFLSLKIDACSFCGKEFNKDYMEGPGERLHHLMVVHEIEKCDTTTRFFDVRDFRQHLLDSHAGFMGGWIDYLEVFCQGYTKDEPGE